MTTVTCHVRFTVQAASGKINLKPRKLTTDQLKAILRSLDAAAGGKKDQLVSRLRRLSQKAQTPRAFLNKLTCESLKDILYANGAPCTGNKAELVRRVCRVA